MDEIKNCVYRFLDKDGKILYVGSTTQALNLRLGQHNCGHLCDCCKLSTNKVEYIVLPTIMDIRVAELYYINKYQPPYNTQNKYDDGISYKIDQLDKMNWIEYEGKLPFKKQKAYKNYNNPFDEFARLVKYYKEIINNKEDDK